MQIDVTMTPEEARIIKQAWEDPAHIVVSSNKTVVDSFTKLGLVCRTNMNFNYNILTEFGKLVASAEFGRGFNNGVSTRIR